MTIIIAGHIDLAAADAERVIREAEPLIVAALDEPGCRAYSWALDPRQPGRVQVFEEWADEASLVFHFANVAYAEMGDCLRSGAGILGFSVQKYRFDHVEPVYDDTGTPRADFFLAPEAAV